MFYLLAKWELRALYITAGNGGGDFIYYDGLKSMPLRSFLAGLVEKRNIWPVAPTEGGKLPSVL